MNVLTKTKISNKGAYYRIKNDVGNVMSTLSTLHF